MADDVGPPKQTAYLLQSPINPFPVRGELELTDATLRFALSEPSGWVEKELGLGDLKSRLESGETVLAFDLQRASLDLSWPKQFMGAAMKVSNPGTREWIVSLIFPSSSLLSTYKSFKYRSLFKAWKAALGS